MTVVKKALAFIGEAICFFLAFATSIFGWIPHFTSMSIGCFLALDAVLAVAFAWMMLREQK